MGDLTGDGRQSIVIVNMNQKPSLLIDRSPRTGSYLRVRLNGSKSNRSAIGARVTIEAAGLKQMDEVRSGGSFYSQNDLALHFGLGKATEVDRLTVRWPNGESQEWKKIRADRTIDIIEGAGPDLK